MLFRSAKTTIAPYSMRGRDLPTIAAPRTWDEVESGAAGGTLEHIMFDDMLDRVDDVGDLTSALH